MEKQVMERISEVNARLSELDRGINELSAHIDELNRRLYNVLRVEPENPKNDVRPLVTNNCILSKEINIRVELINDLSIVVKDMINKLEI